MTEADLLSQAVAELYTTDHDAFTQRRGALAAAARAAGHGAAAKQISGLRRPSRSAWVVNRLVRGDPTVASRLAELGDELRSGEATRDGTRMRELSQARRRLIETLVSEAMAAAGQDSPAVRKEVSATLAAALADPEFAAKMAEGSLLRAEPAPGFGPAELMAAPPVPAAAETERERRHRDAAATVEGALAEANQAAARERADQAAVQELEQQLAGARQRLQETRREARRADSALRQARQALSRVR